MIPRLIALAIMLAIAAAALLLPARPTPMAVEGVRPAKADLWIEFAPAPPVFCPTPQPICREGCPKPRSTA